MPTAYQVTEQRPLKTRDRRSAQRLAGWLAARRVSPNLISVAGCVAGVLAGAMLALTATVPLPWRRLLFLAAAGLVQLRLLCNLLDGMVAVGSGRASALGELFNEVPDRISDAATLIGAGYAAGSCATLGYLAACVAVFTAYVRAVGKIASGRQDFGGPMAKPHRMFAVTVACVLAALLPTAWQAAVVGPRLGLLGWALVVIFAGSLLTSWLRLRRTARALAAGAQSC